MRATWSCTLVASLTLALLPTPAEARPCRVGARTGGRCGDGPPPQFTQPRGLPALITGISLFAFSIPPLFLGTRLVLDPDRRPSEWPHAAGPNSGYHILVTGVAMAVIGVSAAAIGAVRYDRYLRWRRQWEASGRIAPIAGRTAGGGYVGFTMRF